VEEDRRYVELVQVLLGRLKLGDFQDVCHLLSGLLRRFVCHPGLLFDSTNSQHQYTIPPETVGGSTYLKIVQSKM
jgi:hypothetical protein